MSVGSKDFKKSILGDLKDFLKPLGYKKSNTTSELNSEEFIYYVQIQSSQSSTSEVLKLTVNLGILSKRLLNISGLEPDIAYCQWRFRIGDFLDHPTDKWWIVDSLDVAKSTSKDIVKLIENKVFKEWEAIKTNDDLKNIWITGQCTGITDYARKMYLNQLREEVI